jgi:diphosphomevalonate decarboxylase
MAVDLECKKNKVAWQSPSNIALVKYWGKKGFQIPANPSLSMTLSSSFTETSVEFIQSNTPGKISLEFFFEGEKNELFEGKIKKYFETISGELPFLKHFHFIIHSKNTFPHSAGIASSASAMSALALCLCSIEQILLEGRENQNDRFFKRASYFARIGSGSAARSVYGTLASWGETDLIDDSSDDYATQFSQVIHPVFDGFRDSILIVSKGEKEVSSRAGHALMNNHPYAEARYAQAVNNLKKLIHAIPRGDLNTFVEVVENEALSLHAMMMASSPGFLLFGGNTLAIIKEVVKFRKQSGVKVCFTLDAGPNVHLLYPEKNKEKVKQFIKEHLLKYCEGETVINDLMGPGPKRV